MPIYEYRCSACGATFSRLSRHVETASRRACERCGADAAERTPAPFALHLSMTTRIEQIDPRIERELDAVDTVKRDPLAGLNLSGPSPDR